MGDKSGRYRCNVCNKNYSSANSLWNHNKKFHTNTVVECCTTEVLCGTTKYACRLCNKKFNDIF